jgi:putative nucleotidyltransferase with HDIG domain
VTKILGFSFAVIATVLAAVFVLLSWQTRTRVTRAIVDTIEASQLRYADLETRLRRERWLQAATLAENPTLKAAVDTYQTERGAGLADADLLTTIQHELTKLQLTLRVPALSVTDLDNVILASAGPQAADWASGDRVSLRASPGESLAETMMTRGARTYLTTIVPLVFGEDLIGQFMLASPVDDAYVRQLARESLTEIAVVMNGRLVATSLAPALRPAVERAVLPDSGTVSLDGDEYVVRRLLSVDGAQVFALGSATAPIRAATREAAWVFIATAIGALLLAGVGSWWVARTLADPIDRLRVTLAQMAAARDFERPLPRTGASVELDALAGTFDALRAAVSAAEAESESAYLGVIGALAAALDARDPYTAGHSERVAGLSVAIGREMQLSENDLEVLRLGALLHDIGKIGVSDAILRKPATLNDEEFEQIKQHPTLGARILKPLNFLSEHLAIVELHHEQPDGRGYPYGLAGDAIPLLARIVHVADAFDAMTTPRAYRPGRPATEAMSELWRWAGTMFDLQVVQVMARMPATLLVRPPAPEPATNLERGQIGGALVPFRLRAVPQARRTAS